MAESVGVCVNYQGRCSRFEYPVLGAVEGEDCVECGEKLLHESGLTWVDARRAGYATAGQKLAINPESLKVVEALTCQVCRQRAPWCSCGRMAYR